MSDKSNIFCEVLFVTLVLTRCPDGTPKRFATTTSNPYLMKKYFICTK